MKVRVPTGFDAMDRTASSAGAAQMGLDQVIDLSEQVTVAKFPPPQEARKGEEI